MVTVPAAAMAEREILQGRGGREVRMALEPVGPGAQVDQEATEAVRAQRMVHQASTVRRVVQPMVTTDRLEQTAAGVRNLSMSNSS